MRVVDLGFTILHLYEEYGISHIKDDVVLDLEKTQILLTTFNEYYKGEPFVYISQRQKNYNVNPTIYMDLHKESSLLGIGIACERPERCVIANFEKQFCKVPFEIFYTIKDAEEWALKLYKKKKADL